MALTVPFTTALRRYVTKMLVIELPDLPTTNDEEICNRFNASVVRKPTQAVRVRMMRVPEEYTQLYESASGIVTMINNGFSAREHNPEPQHCSDLAEDVAQRVVVTLAALLERLFDAWEEHQNTPGSDGKLTPADIRSGLDDVTL
jgi:hypothetical protein